MPSNDGNGGSTQAQPVSLIQNVNAAAASQGQTLTLPGGQQITVIPATALNLNNQPSGVTIRQGNNILQVS